MVTVACQTITTMPQPEDWPCDLWLRVVNDAIEADSCVVAVNCLHTYKFVNSRQRPPGRNVLPLNNINGCCCQVCNISLSVTTQLRASTASSL